MNSLETTAVVSAMLFAALLLGRIVRRFLPPDHLSTDSKDAVKFAMGLVATMTALLLGLLVSSAKSNYDAERAQVITMAAKLTFLDRILSLYGAEANDVRQRLRGVAGEAILRIWPDDKSVAADLGPNEQTGDAFYVALQGLAPHDEERQGLKAQAVALVVELGQLRTLLQAQSVPSVSMTLLGVVVCWLVVIFFSSSLLAPPNAMTGVALAAAAGSVAAAVFLILELDQPFSGLLRISSGPMLAALGHLAR